MLATHLASLELGERANAIELKSGPGVGKSTTVWDMCALMAVKLNKPIGLVIEMLATIESVDVRGFMLPFRDPVTNTASTMFTMPPWMPVTATTIVFTPDGSIFDRGMWNGPVPDVGVLFLDEFGQAGDAVKKAAAELILSGGVGDKKLPTGWRVIAASNRLTDRSGVIRPLTFITNRRMEILVDADVETWMAWANNQPVERRPHHFTISFAAKQPDLVFRDAVPPGDEPFCTPRSLVLMDRDLKALRSDEDRRLDRMPLDGIARECCKGWIGGGESAQFYTHLKYGEQIPDIKDIERDPAKAKLPPGRDGQMVCAYMLSANVHEKNVEKVIDYILRMNVEMQVLFVKACMPHREKAALFATTGKYGAWLMKHKDTLIAAGA
jgi:hypothetical protein